MNGAVELVKAAGKHGVKPVVGLEAYFVDDRTMHEGKVERNHLTLLAGTDEGYRNLVKLSSGGVPRGLHPGQPGGGPQLVSPHAGRAVWPPRAPPPPGPP